jgi:hypothetical protein
MVSKTETTVSVERVYFQSATHTKKQQAWRYKGNLVARAASATINGRKLVDPKPGANGEVGLPRRKQESNFFLTINPNLAPREGTDVSRVTAAVEKMVELLGANAGVKSILKFGPKDEHYKTDRFEDVILNVDWKPGVEMGGVQGRVHAHVWVWATISHISQVQVDVHKLQYLCRHLPAPVQPGLRGDRRVVPRDLRQAEAQRARPVPNDQAAVCACEASPPGQLD